MTTPLGDGRLSTFGEGLRSGLGDGCLSTRGDGRLARSLDLPFGISRRLATFVYSCSRDLARFCVSIPRVLFYPG